MHIARLGVVGCSKGEYSSCEDPSRRSQLQITPSGCEQQVKSRHPASMCAVAPVVFMPHKGDTIRQGSRQLMWRKPHNTASRMLM